MSKSDTIKSAAKNNTIIGRILTAADYVKDKVEEKIADPTYDLIPFGPGANANSNPAVREAVGGFSGVRGATTTIPSTEESGLDLGGTTGGATGGYSAADTRLQYQDQIDQLNSLLGNIAAQRQQGLSRLGQSFDSQNQRLTEQQQRDLGTYEQQRLQNEQARQQGIGQVDSFANNSYNSLQRLLSGAGAGNSSVARSVVPQLVSKAAGTRRQGVFDTAGQNEQAIATARGDAEDQYRYSFEDLANQRKNSEQNFLESVGNSEIDLLNKRAAAEAARASAAGGGYLAARTAAAGTRADIDARTAQLSQLFSQYAPSFTAKAVNLQRPELGQYTVDPAQINADQNLPTESSYYLSQLKKRQELR